MTAIERARGALTEALGAVEELDRAERTPESGRVVVSVRLAKGIVDVHAERSKPQAPQSAQFWCTHHLESNFNRENCALCGAVLKGSDS